MATELQFSQLNAGGSGWLGMSGGVSGKISVYVRLLPLLVEVVVVVVWVSVLRLSSMVVVVVDVVVDKTSCVNVCPVGEAKEVSVDAVGLVGGRRRWR